VARLPSNLKIRGFLSKAVLKDALKGVVPAENLKREKRGFAVPVARWFKTDLREFLNDHLRPSRVAGAGLVRQSVIDELITKHQSGAADYGHHLWSLLMLELWHRAFMGGDSVRDNQPGMFPDTVRTPQVT
jgi:asparagine synthase (glutamine-hydrolysing)